MKYPSDSFRRAKIRKIIAIAAPVLVLCVAFAIVLIKVIIPNGRYKAAVKLYESGSYDEAVSAFKALKGYKDSEELIEKCYIGKYGEEKYSMNKSIGVGDTYVFGAYEQDNDASDGKEAIEWIVLDRDGMSLLLVSRYALECRQYNSARNSVTWETSSLREWLNGEFLSAAFSPQERESILLSTVAAEKNPSYNTPPGNDTEDKLFLLSVNEVYKYFDTNDTCQCLGTAYCVAQEADNASNGSFRWWLRTPGFNALAAASVSYGGNVLTRGDGVNRSDFAVRPALWLIPEF